MGTVASQITSLMIVYSIVYSGTDQRKHQSSASLALVRGIRRDRWIPRTKGQLRETCFHLMTSSWNVGKYVAADHWPRTHYECLMVDKNYFTYQIDAHHLDLMRSSISLWRDTLVSAYPGFIIPITAQEIFHMILHYIQRMLMGSYKAHQII